MRELFATLADDTLASAINSSVTSLDVSSAASFPASGDFRIRIDDEILLVTAVSTNTFTIERGIEGTTAATHPSSAVVTHVLTEGGLTQTLMDHIPFYGIVPPLRILDSAGARLDDTDFTWRNQGACTKATNANGYIELSIPDTHDAPVYLMRPLPSTPYTLTACIRGDFAGETTHNTPTAGLVVMNTASSNKNLQFGIENRVELDRLRLYGFSDLTTQTTDNSVVHARPSYTDNLWMRISDDGTTLSFSASTDGVNFVLNTTQARATLVGAIDEIGFCCWSRFDNSKDLKITLLAWDGE